MASLSENPGSRESVGSDLPPPDVRVRGDAWDHHVGEQTFFRCPRPRFTVGFFPNYESGFDYAGIDVTIRRRIRRLVDNLQFQFAWR